MSIACTSSSEEWILYIYLYSYSLEFGVFKWFLVFMTRILRIYSYFGAQKFVLLIDFFGVGIAWHARSFHFPKAKFFGYLCVNLHREMRCFISKDLDVKVCFRFFFWQMCLWKTLSVLKKIICTKVQKCLPLSSICKSLQWI